LEVGGAFGAGVVVTGGVGGLSVGDGSVGGVVVLSLFALESLRLPEFGSFIEKASA
jgi:hypothetical protein